MRDNPFGPWATALSPMIAARLSTFWVRRLNNLSQLCEGLPVVSRRGRYGLFTLAAAALVIPSLRGMPAARPGDDANRAPLPAAGAPAEGNDQAIPEFLQKYRLAPGQVLKLVPPPRPAGIRVWLKREHPYYAEILDDVAAMTFRWRDSDHLKVQSARVGGREGWSLRGLPQYLECDLYSVDIEGDPELLKTAIDGDWIYRQDASDESKVRALEKIVQESLGPRITLQFRQVERDVVVVRGTYRAAPLAGRKPGQVEIYGKQVVPNGGGAGGGSGNFNEFLKWIGEWIERPVVSAVEEPPKQTMEWFYNARSPFTEQMRREDHDEVLVLQHLREQTGLTFTRERKTIRVLVIERGR